MRVYRKIIVIRTGGYVNSFLDRVHYLPIASQIRISSFDLLDEKIILWEIKVPIDENDDLYEPLIEPFLLVSNIFEK